MSEWLFAGCEYGSHKICTQEFRLHGTAHLCTCKCHATNLEKEVIDRMAQNAMNATPQGEIIDFERAYGEQQ